MVCAEKKNLTRINVECLLFDLYIIFIYYATKAAQQNIKIMHDKNYKYEPNDAVTMAVIHHITI